MQLLVRLLILGLVPVLILTTPTTAQAATVRGPASLLSIDLRDPSASGMGHGFDCNLSGQWALDEGGASGVIAVKGDCVTGWYVEYSVMEIRNIMLSGAGGCTHSLGAVDDAETAWALSLPTAEPCEITTITVNMCEDSYGASESGDCHYVQQPWSILLPDVEPSSAECPVASMGAPNVKFTASDGQSIANWFDVTARFPFSFKQPQTYQLRVGLVFREPSGSLWVGWPGGNNGFVNGTVAAGQGSGSVTYVRVSSYGPHTGFETNLVGVQVHLQGYGEIFGGTFGNDWGTTQGANCFFYFGDKVANLEGTDIDEPSGPISKGDAPTGPVSEPEADPPSQPGADEGCTFRLSDPTTWLEGGICAVVGILAEMWDVLKSILGAIGNLVSGIVSGILGGLSDLFVPDEWPDWGSIPSPLPTGWLPDLPSLGGSGCGALSMPQLSLGFNDWTVGPVTFADTCDAPWPLVRLLTYNALLAMVLGSAVWMGFRAVMSGLGMGVQTGSGGDDD